MQIQKELGKKKEKEKKRMKEQEEEEEAGKQSMPPWFKLEFCIC